MATEATSTDLETRDKQTLEQEGTRPGPVFRPDVDIVEERDRFVVTADLPGVGEENVKVDLVEGVLSIDAQSGFEPDPAWNSVYAEYRRGGYHREFRLSDAIDVEKISASMRDGVLELNLPKAEPHRPRQITVQSA